MVRRGKVGKKLNAKEEPKQDVGKAKGPSKGNSHDGEAAKKGASKGDTKKGAGQAIANLGGFIFMCNSSTKSDCFKYRVFGLNEGKKNLVEQVRKGMRLFLFDIDLRLLYGIYTAASAGSFKLEPDAFGGSFPWQVRFSIQKDCLPLSEDLFIAAIKDNYMNKRRFKVELTTEQVHRLVKLFRPLPGGPGRSPPHPRITASEYFDDPLKAGHSPLRPRIAASDYFDDPLKAGRSPLRPRIAASDYFDDPLKAVRSPLRPRITASDYIDDPLKARPPRFPEVDIFAQDRHLLAPPPRSYHDAPGRILAEKQVPSAQSLTKYAHLYDSDDRRTLDGHAQGIAPKASRESVYAADDLYLGREPRLQQGLSQNNQIGVGSLLPGHSLAPASLSAYSTESLRPISDLRQPIARDDIYSIYSQGSTLGTDMDHVLRSRLQVPDLRGDILERRVSALDPMGDSLAQTGGMSTELLRGKPFSDMHATGYGGLRRYESSASLLSGIPGASGLLNRGELLQSRYYGGGLL